MGRANLDRALSHVHIALSEADRAESACAGRRAQEKECVAKQMYHGRVARDRSACLGAVSAESAHQLRSTLAHRGYILYVDSYVQFYVITPHCFLPMSNTGDYKPTPIMVRGAVRRYYCDRGFLCLRSTSEARLWPSRSSRTTASWIILAAFLKLSMIRYVVKFVTILKI